MDQDLLRQIDGDIAAQGYAVYTVGDDAGLTWTYTIGLDDQGRPELIVVGQDHVMAVTMISRVIDHFPQLVAGVSLIGVHPDGGVATLSVAQDVAMAGQWFGLAHLRRWSTQPMRALQLVTPDDDGKWEWTDAQPLLGEPWW